MKSTKKDWRLLFDNNKDLAEKFARNFESRSGKLNGCELSDYHQFAMLGLAKAAQTFNPENETKFSTWAHTKMRSYTLDGVRSYDELTRGLRKAGDVKPAINLSQICKDDSEHFDLLASIYSPGENAEYFDEIERLFTGLNFEHRAVLYLSTICDLAIWQIAKILGKEVEIIRVTRLQAMEYLKHSLKKSPAANNAENNNVQLTLFSAPEPSEN